MRPNKTRGLRWMGALLGGLVLAAIFTLKAGSVIAVDAARKQLEAGGVLVDVRTVEEFQAGHLTNALNVPLGELKQMMPDRVPDKSKVLLLYCRSGRRSGIAETELRSLGYTNVFNLGSFGRAADIIGGRTP
jgi:phage shock protein E